MQAPAAGFTPYRTSGTTGGPVTWWRGRDQLDAEAELLAGLFADARPDLVVTHAPPEHLFGHLMGVLVPRLLGVPATRLHLLDGLPADCARPLIAAVPATWWALGHAARALGRYERVEVVHSTAPLPERAAAVCAAHERLRLTELHGSTETGLVGVRRGGAGAWELARDVTPVGPWLPGTERRLSVSGPRLARTAPDAALPDAFVLDDLVVPAGPRSYRLVGRRARLVKVNGRRVNADGVLNRLRAAVPGCRLSWTPVSDPVRGEWYEILAEDPATVPRVAHAVSTLLPPAERPRRVRPALMGDAEPPSR
ncbi:acyl-CoA synthetase [Streptomyces sp. NPDC006339]|uniref:acyl-CoA synthetase n=1 Tax=Streptomyces sp. NPDC006339 TaxID=3156755 RepID=UPI0033B5BC73